MWGGDLVTEFQNRYPLSHKLEFAGFQQLYVGLHAHNLASDVGRGRGQSAVSKHWTPLCMQSLMHVEPGFFVHETPSCIEACILKETEGVWRKLRPIFF